ncbi:MAG TPA: alpha/beta hydrolase [Erysipelotrichaceae bacterium]|uniref:alpha/beta hydrolase n=1 Tax=Sharpea azabuensis TaxID=322505 RepID=UPI0008E7BDD8|nr:alpha/beta hydrolase [Sharpea azabuensis]SFE04149.1 Lysophospholipase, alpha-beta hydrolase superfamily [Sharpea azabuensis]SFK94595.1 Lysophospholipase, alpha-beta hydrolase superfamily [Sharpea azabuensis]HBZ87979.1 alpha/beta hydrolase [Erysipelotrichaceae bacterium]
MKREDTMTSALKTTVHYSIYEPTIVLRIKAVVIVVHDLGENRHNYEHFANALSRQGYVVVVPDLVGHGESLVNFERGYFGDGDISQAIIKDYFKLQNIMIRKYPDTFYFMLGSGVGSNIALLYASKYGDYLSGLMLLSPIRHFSHLTLRKLLTRMQIRFKGMHYHSKNRLLKLRPTHESGVVVKRRDQFNDHFTYASKALEDIYQLVERTNSVETLQNIPHHLPMLFAGGKKDAMTHFLAENKWLCHLYQQEGFEEIRCKSYMQSGHHLLFDVEREDIYKDLLDYLNEHIYY